MLWYSLNALFDRLSVYFYLDGNKIYILIEIQNIILCVNWTVRKFNSSHAFDFIIYTVLANLYLKKKKMHTHGQV